MKKLIFGLIIVFAQDLFCQDSIYKKTGEIISSKVLEINDSEVKFKKTGNLNGPTYAELKSGLLRIKFANGTIDTINKNVDVKTPVATQTVIVEKQNFNPKRSVMYMAVGDEQMYSMIDILPSSDDKTRMKREYALMKQYQRNQYLAGTLGWVIGFGVPIVVTAVSLGSYDLFSGGDPFPAIIAGALTGAVIRTVGQVVMKINKNKRKNARKNIMTIYAGMQ